MKQGNWLWLLLLSVVFGRQVAWAEEQAGADAQASEPEAGLAGQDLLLGYKVYLARGNQQAAYQVARKALRSYPNDDEWLKRFAQVAEWVGKPSEAIEAWLRLAQKTGSKEAWAAVGRLAPSLIDDEAMLSYQQQLLRSQGPKEPLVKDIVGTYERLGRPQDGLTFLGQQAGQNPPEYLLEAEAGLAERSGQDERAVALFSELIKRFGPHENWLLRRAALRYSRGELAPAWNEMKSFQGSMPSSAVGYWQTYAELSRVLNHTVEARQAYDMLMKQGKAGPDELRNYAALLQGQDGMAAARLNESLFRQYGRDSALITSLYLYGREGHPEAASALLARLSPEQLASLERDPDFLEQRGQLYWQQRRLALAQADYSRGLHLAPNNTHLLEALVAVLIQANAREALSRVLQTQEPRAMALPTLWSSWAGGWNALDRPDKALPYLQAFSRSKPGDKLGLLALADTYERVGDPEAAARLRHKVFAGDTRTLTSNESPARAAVLNEALFALRVDQAAPEPALNLLRSRLKRDAKGRYDPAARELLLNWLLAHDSNDRAEQWARHSYQGTVPLWAQTGFALASGDRVAQRDLLERHAEQLPVNDRVEAARLSDWPRLAETLSFEGLEQKQDDDAQASGFQSLMTERGNWFELEGQALRQGALTRDGASLSLNTALTAQWRLELEGAHYSERSEDVTQLAAAPKVDRFGVLFTRQVQRDTWRLGVSHSAALESYQGFTLGQNYRYSGQLSLNWRADYNAEASESAPLLAGGNKHQLMAGLNWTPDGRDFVMAEAEAMRFHGQTGQSLGDGTVLTLAVGRHLLADPISQTVRLAGTSAQFKTDSGVLDPRLAALVPAGQTADAHFYVPGDYHQISLFWDIGEPQPAVYERRWRGFGELGASYANTTGSGYSARLGLHGPVLGYDRLSLSLEQAKGGQDNGSITRRALITYRYFY